MELSECRWKLEESPPKMHKAPAVRLVLVSFPRKESKHVDFLRRGLLFGVLANLVHLEFGPVAFAMDLAVFSMTNSGWFLGDHGGIRGSWEF